jgi:hypothetical protein
VIVKENQELLKGLRERFVMKPSLGKVCLKDLMSNLLICQKLLHNVIIVFVKTIRGEL